MASAREMRRETRDVLFSAAISSARGWPRRHVARPLVPGRSRVPRAPRRRRGSPSTRPTRLRRASRRCGVDRTACPRPAARAACACGPRPRGAARRRAALASFSSVVRLGDDRRVVAAAACDDTTCRRGRPGMAARRAIAPARRRAARAAGGPRRRPSNSCDQRRPVVAAARNLRARQRPDSSTDLPRLRRARPRCSPRRPRPSTPARARPAASAASGATRVPTWMS